MELGAVGCVACGTPVGQTGVTSNGTTQTIDKNGISNVPINTLEFVETNRGYSRTLKASVTNEVGTSLGGALLEAITGGRTSIGTTRNGHAKGQNIDPEETQALSLLDLNQSEDEVIVDAPIQHTLPSAESRGDAEKLRHIFRYNGDQLRLSETRLKAKSKLDAARRLTYLFLYAHELEGRHEIQRKVLNEELKKAGYLDSNAANWINKSPDLFREEDRVGLQKSGLEEAQKVLAEVLDPNISNNWSLNTGGGARGAKSNGKGDENIDSSPKNGSRKSNSFSQTVESWVTAWKALSLNIDGFSAIKDRSTSEKGIFALWAVGKATSEPEQVASSYMIAQFLYLTFGVKVSERNLGRSLGEIAGQGALIKVQGGFKLLSPGIAEAEKMAGFALNASQTTTSPQDSENSQR
ncbi:hypothetical protein [Trichocoleus sp. FACHB-832]|uniref:hypothetical protein n=1 Tax=Trichocoleus sp. FACHB-832 TaxID=2692875 RepID=UPI001685AC67|nr:hypothetical protein [Trichocoleus sp. FACHB-832]